MESPAPCAAAIVRHGPRTPAWAPTPALFSSQKKITQEEVLVHADVGFSPPQGIRTGFVWRSSKARGSFLSLKVLPR